VLLSVVYGLVTPVIVLVPVVLPVAFLVPETFFFRQTLAPYSGQTFVPILYLRFLPSGSTSVSSLAGTTGTFAMIVVTILLASAPDALHEGTCKAEIG
jgi:hypothetical protein